MASPPPKGPSPALRTAGGRPAPSSLPIGKKSKHAPPPDAPRPRPGGRRPCSSHNQQHRLPTGSEQPSWTQPAPTSQQTQCHCRHPAQSPENRAAGPLEALGAPPSPGFRSKHTPTNDTRASARRNACGSVHFGPLLPPPPLPSRFPAQHTWLTTALEAPPKWLPPCPFPAGPPPPSSDSLRAFSANANCLRQH